MRELSRVTATATFVISMTAVHDIVGAESTVLDARPEMNQETPDAHMASASIANSSGTLACTRPASRLHRKASSTQENIMPAQA